MFNNQFFQLNRIQHQIPWKGEKMKDKLSRLFACLIAVFMVIAMVGMSSTAKAEDGAETPISTATPTADPTDDSVAEDPEVDATEVDSAAKGEKPETKTTKTPKPTATATVEPTEDPTEDPTDPPVVLPDTPVSECTNGVWTITITYPADAYGDANGAILWYDGQFQEDSGNLDPGESYTFEIRAGLNSLRLDWHGWASQYPDASWELQRPSDCGSPSEPSPTPTEPTTKPTVKPTTKPTVKPTAKPTAEPTVKPTAKPTAEPTKVPTTAPSGDPGSDKDKSDPSGPAKTGAIGGSSTGTFLVGAWVAAILTSALVAMRMGRRRAARS